MAALQCHPETRICRTCLGWLLPRAGAVTVTSTLPVVDMEAAVRFYEAARFDVEQYDAGFAFVSLDDQSTFDLDLAEHIDPARNGAGCYVRVGGVDEWHARRVGAGLDVSAVEDKPWGMHEFTLTAPSGNHVRVGEPVP